MKIEYLKKFQERNSFNTWKSEGLTIDEIEHLETTYNSGETFPKTIREYLFIGGKFHGLEISKGLGYEWMQEEARTGLEYYGVKIERPYFVFKQLDSCEVFGFFYLDEDEDDPKVYNCVPDYIAEGEEFISPIPQKTFVPLVEAYIEKALADEQTGGYSTPSDEQ